MTFAPLKVETSQLYKPLYALASGVFHSSGFVKRAL